MLTILSIVNVIAFSFLSVFLVFFSFIPLYYRFFVFIVRFSEQEILTPNNADNTIQHQIYWNGIPTYSEKTLIDYNKKFDVEKSSNHSTKDLDPLKFLTEGKQDKIEQTFHFKRALSTCHLCNKFNESQTQIDLSKMNEKLPSVCQGRIDAVWLWVNGSDETWRSSHKKFNQKFEENRFRETGTLKYSMRSVFKYLPYIKNSFC
ncbi:hypothetical protein EIN_488980, partial [Entamoeba invadens IP1]